MTSTEHLGLYGLDRINSMQKRIEVLEKDYNRVCLKFFEIHHKADFKYCANYLHQDIETFLLREVEKRLVDKSNPPMFENFYEREGQLFVYNQLV